MLYFKRDEKAISETAAKYGMFCHSVALNMLSNNENAQECTNSTNLLTLTRNSILPKNDWGSFANIRAMYSLRMTGHQCTRTA